MDWNGIKFDWNRTKAFLVTAEEGSFSAAARVLETTQPTIGRQVSQLEEELGVLLFERVGKRLELTTSGIDLLEHARSMAEAATRFSLVATGRATAVEGLVTITASETVAAFLLPPVLARLRVEYPGIELEVSASNEVRDLLRREADIAVRNVQPKHPDLIGKKLGTGRAYFYASPAYIARVGPFCSPEDFRRAELFAFNRSSLMIDGLRAVGLAVDRAQFPIVSPSHLVQWALCKRGVGICMMMEEVGDAEPCVTRVLESVSIPIPVWLVSHRELRTSRRIRIVFDMLAEVLGTPHREGAKT